MQLHNIEEEELSYIYIQMHPKYQNQRHAADQVDIFPSAQNLAAKHQ